MIRGERSILNGEFNKQLRAVNCEFFTFLMYNPSHLRDACTSYQHYCEISSPI
jgi:hypothetical protein